MMNDCKLCLYTEGTKFFFCDECFNALQEERDRYKSAIVDFLFSSRREKAVEDLRAVIAEDLSSPASKEVCKTCNGQGSFPVLSISKCFDGVTMNVCPDCNTESEVENED